MLLGKLLTSLVVVIPLSTLAQLPGEHVRYQEAPHHYPYVSINGPLLPIWKMTLDDPRDNIVYGLATMVTRSNGEGATVGGQINAWAGNGITGQTWGTATEAVGMKGNKSILVGLEALVANQEPEHDLPKIGINIVFNNGGDLDSAGEGSNVNSVGLWFTATSMKSFESAIKLDRRSISGSISKPRPAVLDLEDLDPDTIGEVDLIRLPGGKSIRFNPYTSQLEAR
ncbi:MAG TPA: hypothetical protein VFV55_09915 [Usitatibacteraceae bacterium]|nr:hypothetical protein [Usitatibacteraceae bacterium]